MNPMELTLRDGVFESVFVRGRGEYFRIFRRKEELWLYMEALEEGVVMPFHALDRAITVLGQLPSTPLTTSDLPYEHSGGLMHAQPALFSCGAFGLSVNLCGSGEYRVRVGVEARVLWTGIVDRPTTKALGALGGSDERCYRHAAVAGLRKAAASGSIPDGLACVIRPGGSRLNLVRAGGFGQEEEPWPSLQVDFRSSEGQLVDISLFGSASGTIRLLAAGNETWVRIGGGRLTQAEWDRDELVGRGIPLLRAALPEYAHDDIGAPWT